MKKNLRFLLALAIGWLTSTGAWALEEVNGVYQIGTADDLIEFANMVNGDAAKSGSAAVLTADIDLSGKEYPTIGRDASRYWGTFDGQGHRIKNMSITGTTKELGLFSVVSTATIKNLILDKSCVINSGDCTAALAGCCNGNGTLTIENVGVECDVTGTGPNAAAFVGCNYSGGGLKVVIKNCYNTGNISAQRESAVFSGWFSNNGEVINCWNTGKVNGQDGSNSLGRGIAADKFINTYDLNSENAKIDKTVLAGYDASWMTDGHLCYILNGDQTTISWYQKIGTDATPLPFGTDVVYANGELKCDGTSAGGELTYSNSATSVIPPHTYTDGFCSVCGALDKDYMTADAEGYYNLATGNDVKWFAAIVAQVNQSANARLTADIDYTAYKQGFIGISQGTPFRGVFDGQGHTITIDIVNAGSERTGLFAYINAATIKNLVVEGSAISADKNCVGGLGGRSDGNGTLIENVVVKTNVKYTGTNGDATCGGFFANMEATATMKNCAFYGSIDSGSAEGNGGLTGWAGGGNSISIINCLVVPTSYTKNGNSNDFARNNPKVTNSFAVATDDARLASGEMAFLLNEKVSGATVWYQKINTDALPMPIAQEGAVVYANGDLKCDGVTPKEGSELTFSNTEGSNVDDHQFNDWGFCTVCDAVQPDYMTAADGVYTVENAKQLNWLANYTGKINPNVNVVINADIDMTEVVGFPGFGTEDKRFSGSIDGQKHIIKNLTMNMGDGRAAGLIRFATAPVTVKNLTIDASCSFKAKNYAGAFIGDLNGNGAVTLEQLGNEANVTVDDQNPGGIVGCNFSGEAKITMLNCYNAGTIRAGWEGGGLSGWLGNGAKMTNCYNMGEVVKGEAFARGNDQVKENCFDTSSTPAEDFTNGTVLAKLQEAAPYIWYSSAEEDGHPVLYVTEWGAQKRTPYTGVVAQEGDFYLYNVDTGYWLQNNNRQTVDWNSHAELDPVGYAFGLKAIEGGWQIDPKMGNNHSLNASNLYMDTGDAMTTWTFEPVEAEGVSNAYTIKSGDVVLGASNDKFLQKTTNNSIWQIVTKEERLAVMQAEYPNAKGTAPVDLSWLIPGGDFNIAHETAMQLNGTTGIEAGAAFVSGQTQGNGVREIWNNATGYDINYTLNDLPDGIYRFTVSGYYRDGKTKDIGAKHKNGTEELRAIVYANDQEQPLMSVVAPERTASGQGCNVNTSGYFVPDNIGDAAIATREGIYVNTPIEVNLTGGTLKIGVRKEGGADGDWTILDYFKVQYFGPESLDLYLSLLQNAINEAEAFDASVTSDALAAELTTAINEAKAALNATTKEDITAATNQLNTVLAAAKSVNVTALKQTVALAKEEGLNTAAGETAIVEAKNASEIEQPLYDLRAARKLNAMRMPDIYTGSKPAEGKVYLFNVGTGTFLGTGSDWNTHAAVDQAGIEIELINVNNEEYTFKFKTGRGGGWMAYNGYVDTGGQDFWHFMPVEGKEGVYNISSTGNDGFLLGYDPNGGTDGKKYWNTIAIDRTGVDNPMNQWKVITPAEREALLAKATEGDPVDVSYLIKNASLNRQDGYDMWEKLCDGGNGGARVSTVTDGNNDRAADYAYEYFEPNSFSFTQTIEGLTPGKYEVSVQGFFRNGNGGAQAEAYNNGEELKQLAYLVANDQTALLPNIASVLSKVPGIGDLQACKDGEFPNMPQSAIEYFETGYYKTTLPVTVGEDGTLTLGVKKDSKELNGDWVVIDNFRLRYLGDNSIKTMSILGDFTGGWEMEKAADMTQSTENPAIWTLHVEDFEVKFEEGQTERTYEYKATANHAWGVYELPEQGNQNWVFGETRDYKAGVYDLDFTVDTENHTLTLVPTFDEVATAISEMKADAKQAPVYNLNGQKVEKAQKGLYIIGGKKVVVRK